MAEQEMIQITVIIAGRPYPLKINTGDEPVIRKIVKEINEKINKFQLSYSQKDKQDCLSMCLLTYAVDLHKARVSAESASQNEGISRRLEQIDELLGSLIK